jgi:ABC-type polar amino acid transport system ATPase subunit
MYWSWRSAAWPSYWKKGIVMIRFEHLTKQFGTGNIVLNDITITVSAGEVIAIIGPSGSGKSTLLRCINYLEMPTSGQIWFDNMLVTPHELSQIRKRIGMVFQQFHLFAHMNVLGNLTYALRHVKKMPRQEAETLSFALLEQVGLKDKATAMPSQLSGGQKQRVAIARALVMRPEVMLYDEPTSALDPENVAEVVDVIRKVVHQGMTTLLVSHEMGLVRDVADRIWFMEQGKILEDTPTEQFFKRPTTPRAQAFLSHLIRGEIA